MSRKLEEYKEYIHQVGEQLKNAPSKRELERMKQQNLDRENAGGYADILHGSKERELIHKIDKQSKNSFRK